MPEYKNPKLAVDAVILNDDSIILIRRGNQPYKGFWALPGGFVDYGEQVEHAVVREVLEETGLNVTVERLVGVYSDPNRDPRGHTVSIAYACKRAGGVLKAGDDASDARFFQKGLLPELAFDHLKIIRDALR